MSSSPDNFNSKDYFDISSEIENSVNSNIPINLISKESAWRRAAISRYYYSAFLTIREEIRQDPNLRNFLNNSQQDHQTIISKLDTLPAQDRFYANNLKNLRKNRNHCDYHLPPRFNITANLVALSNQQAHSIITNSQYIVSQIPL